MPSPPAPAGRGRPPKADLREVLNAIRNTARSGGGWRMLPVHFGRWRTVYWWRQCFVRRLLFHTIHEIALMLDREQSGRDASPSAGVLDSQTVKAAHAPGGGGYDAAKWTKGRKRHIAVDTDEQLLAVNLTTADVQDATGAERIVTAKRWPWLKHLFTDGPTTGASWRVRPPTTTSSLRSCASCLAKSASRSCRAAGSWSVRSAG